MTPFTAWRPDESTVTNAYAEDVENAIPVSVRDDGSVIYGPAQEFAAATDAADGRVLGAKGFVMPNGSIQTVIGTAESLYIVDTSDNTLTDVSGTTYSASTSAPWSFDVFGNTIIATNVNDGPQDFIVGTDTAFGTLAGTPPDAHLVGVWKDQLVLGALGSNLEAVAWSEINDIEDWTGGNADIQQFPGFGRVTAISRGNIPIIIQDRGIQRGTFTGTASVFEFDTLTEDFGCRIRGATTFRRNSGYFWSDEGFKAITPAGEIQHIGFRKIDRWVNDNVALGNDAALLAVSDPVRPLVGWLCALRDESADVYSTLLLYNLQLGEWTKIAADVEYAFGWQTGGVTLEGLDAYGSLDALPFSLDSQAWRANAPLLGAVDTSHRAGLFYGDNLPATLWTGEFGGMEGVRTRMRRVRPMIDGPATITHYGRDNREDTFSMGPTEAVHPRTQEARFNRMARFHKLRVETPAGSDWTRAVGVQETMSVGSRM